MSHEVITIDRHELITALREAVRATLDNRMGWNFIRADPDGSIQVGREPSIQVFGPGSKSLVIWSRTSTGSLSEEDLEECMDAYDPTEDLEIVRKRIEGTPYEIGD